MSESLFPRSRMREFRTSGSVGASGGEIPRGHPTKLLAVDAAVDEHTADQLVLLLAGGGAFTTTEPSKHTRTQLALIPAFLDVDFDVTRDGAAPRIGVRRR